MPQALLYQGFGLHGYDYQKTEYKEGQIFFHVKRSKKRCACCQSGEVIQKGVKTRVLRTIPIGRRPVFAVIQRRRFFCRSCGRTRYERLVVADPKRHYTHHLEIYVMDLCMRMTVRDVAEHTRLHWATVKAIDRKRMKRNLPKEADLRKLRYLGVDEVSVRRGHRYLTTVVDLETGRVVYVGEGRRTDSLEPFIRRLKRLGVELRAVALDMWKPFAKAIRRHYRRLPLVYDVFHILADFSRTLNEIRVDEYTKLKGTMSHLIKGARYLLLRGQETLSLPARQKLELLLRINRPISMAYVLKEDLRRLWALPTLDEAVTFLADWIAKALSSGVAPLRRFARKLRRHAEGILNYYFFPISTAKVEGINNQIKVIKRKAFGYRDLNYFKLKIYNLHTLRYPFVR
jgi:transposase